jgi:hypothetical protein
VVAVSLSRISFLISIMDASLPQRQRVGRFASSPP